MTISRTWTDIYTGVWGLLEGAPGGGDYLLICLAQDAQNVESALGGLPQFKGNIFLYILPKLWSTPVEWAIHQIQPKSIRLVCPAETLPEIGEIETSAGLFFQDYGQPWETLGHVIPHTEPLGQHLTDWLDQLRAWPRSHAR